MASLKFLLFVLIIVTSFSSVCAIEMKNAEEPLPEVQETAVLEGQPGEVETDVIKPQEISEEVPEEVSEGEVLLHQCAGQYIKS